MTWDPCDPMAVRAVGSDSGTATLRLVERFDTWAEAMRFVIALGTLKSKPSLRRQGKRWVVRYEPHLFLINGLAS